MDIKETLARLCALPGPAGFEHAAAQACARELEAFSDRVSIDRMGNVVAEIACGVPGAKRVLLDAHIDEIGFMVTGYKDGFLSFTTLGGVDPRMLPGRELLILAGEGVPGVVSCLPPHLLSAKDAEKTIEIKDLYIDTGLSDGVAKARIPVGTPAVFAGGLKALSGDRVSCKAFDDRACFVVLLRALELMHEMKIGVDVTVLGSVQEELGTRGAITGAYGSMPDFCVASDVTHADTPDAPRDRTFKSGGGPAIGLGPNINRRMSDRMIKLAKENGIRYQLEVMEGHTGTNAWPIQVSREGVATALVSVPVKYMHSPAETLAISDIEDSARLIALFVQSLGKGAL